MITVFLSSALIVFMHFAHELEEKLSTMYNYTTFQTEQQDPRLFAFNKNKQTTPRRKHCLKWYLSVSKTQDTFLKKLSFSSSK